MSEKTAQAKTLLLQELREFHNRTEYPDAEMKILKDIIRIAQDLRTLYTKRIEELSNVPSQKLGTGG